jgi:hypothetical protein
MALTIYDGTPGGPPQQRPSDCIYLLTPDRDVRERMELEALARFVAQVNGELRAYCAATTVPLDELQVGCAVLPGGRLIIEVQALPAETRTLHARSITPRLRLLDRPSVAVGPVVFARCMRLRPAEEQRAFRPPFSMFATAPDAVPLDRVLCEAAAILGEPDTGFNRDTRPLARADTPQPQPHHQPMAALLFERIGIAVVAADDALSIQGRGQPFIVVQKGEKMSKVQYPNGTTAFVDELTLQHAGSRAPQPTQAALDALFAKAARARVLDGGLISGKALNETVLLDVRDETGLTELRARLAILDGPGGHCMCHGGPSVELRTASDEVLAVIGLHHGHGLRWNVWKDDAVLNDGLALLEWLASRGVEAPLAAYRKAHEMQEQQRAARQRWAAAVPAGISALRQAEWQRMAEGDDLTPALDALWAAHPDRRAAIRALFAWFGSGMGPWTNFPLYEQLAERLLLLVPVAELGAALETGDIPSAQLEGASRFFAGHLFGAAGAKAVDVKALLASGGMHVFVPARSGAPANIPAALRHRMLAHCLSCEDADKKARAQSAFADG